MGTTFNVRALTEFAGSRVTYPQGRAVYGCPRLRVDFSDADVIAAGAINPSNADILQIWNIPIGSCLFGALLDVVEAATDTGTATVAIGDATQAAGYLAATTVKTVARTGTIVTDAYGAARLVYAAAGILGLTFAGTATTLVTGIIDIYLPGLFIHPTGLVDITWH